jgi:hypothetical protein
MKRLVALTALSLLAALPLVAGDTPQAKSPTACCLKAAGAQRTVTNLDNGVKIAITGGDPKLVVMIQEETATCPKPGCSKECPMQAEGVKRTVEKTDSGVVITATAIDPAVVTKLQEHAATMWDKDCPHKAAKACPKAKAMADCPHKQGATASQS